MGVLLFLHKGKGDGTAAPGSTTSSSSASLSTAESHFRHLLGMTLLRLAYELYLTLCHHVPALARNPVHVSGMHQLARLLVELRGVRGEPAPAGVVSTISTIAKPEVSSSKVENAWMEEVIELYEAVIARSREVLALPAYSPYCLSCFRSFLLLICVGYIFSGIGYRAGIYQNSK